MADTEPREPPDQVAKDVAVTAFYVVGGLLGFLLLMVIGLVAMLAMMCGSTSCAI
ncbi:MAG: hypothetical protein HY054_14800 [Proteobacteria bacterium]|nr:hypothetical protein [Pseudomonadota bacterium]